MEVGQTVKHNGKMVQILSIEEDDLATVSVWFSSEPHYEVYLSELEPVVVQSVTAPAINTNSAFLASSPKKATPIITQRKAEQIKFDQSLFSEEGVKISCRCGHITKSIAPAYIRAWTNENAAINYVISLCAHCATPHREMFNATN